MSRIRVWRVQGQYRVKEGYTAVNPSLAVEHKSLEKALEDVEYLWDAGFGSSMRSYVVPA